MTPRSPISGKRVADVVSNFIAHPRLKLRKSSIAKYRNTLSSFSSWTKNTHVSQLTRDDLKNFMSHSANVEMLDPSTAVDKAIIVQSVMNEHGAEIKMKKGDWPRVTERQPEIYEADVTESSLQRRRNQSSPFFKPF